MDIELDELPTPLEKQFIDTRQKLAAELDKTKASIDKLEQDIYWTRHAPRPRQQIKTEILAHMERSRQDFEKAARADVYRLATQGGHADLVTGHSEGRHGFRPESLLFFCWDSVTRQAAALIDATPWPEQYPAGLDETQKAEIIEQFEKELEALLIRRDRILSILRQNLDDSHE